MLTHTHAEDFPLVIPVKAGIFSQTNVCVSSVFERFGKIGLAWIKVTGCDRHPSVRSSPPSRE